MALLFTDCLIFLLYPFSILFQKNLLDNTGAYTEEAGSELAGRFVADSTTENTSKLSRLVLLYNLSRMT